jgi:hypothetical protein
MPYGIKCNLITNQSTFPYYVIDRENSGYQLAIPPTDVRRFNVIVPHCDYEGEVISKAFVFYRAGVPVDFLFQRSYTDDIHTTSYVGATSLPVFPGPKLLTTTVTIDVFIASNGTLSARESP